MLGELGFLQERVAQLFGTTSRNLRRWRRGDRPIPHGIQILLRLLAVGAVTAAQVEEAAETVMSSDAMASGNLSAADKVCAFKAAASSDVTTAPGNLSTADKVCALTPKACRWPIGDPAGADFRFCTAAVGVKNSSYCDRHRATAYYSRIIKVAAVDGKQGSGKLPQMKQSKQHAPYRPSIFLIR
jgi:hypothetical protein